MQNIKKGGFTLVELIVVITILAILGTIAFISLQGYSRDARDTKRTADLGNIKTSLELFSLKTGKYPSPDSYSTITYSGGTENVWYQGVVGDIVTINLKSLNEKPLDPLTNTPYTYSVTNSYKEYEVLALYEGSVAYNPILNQANAAVTSLTPKIVGNYNGVFVRTKNYIIPTPSIVIAEPLLTGTPLPLTSSTIKSLIITNGKNIPNNNLTPTQTGSLNINLSVYTGSITKASNDVVKVNSIKAIQNAYTGTTLATQNNIAYILNKTSNIDLVILANSTFLKDNTTKVLSVVVPIDGICGSSTGLNLTTPPITNLCSSGIFSNVVDNGGGSTYTWTCNGADGGITASCNANNTNASIYPGCSASDITVGSNTIAACNIGTNTAGFDTSLTSAPLSYGSLFNYLNNICASGYHIPSKNEWSNLIQTLGLTGGSIGSILKLPAAGYATSYGRQYFGYYNYGYYWSSTSIDATRAYYIRFSPYFNTLVYGNTAIIPKSYSLSIRCFKN